MCLGAAVGAGLGLRLWMISWLPDVGGEAALRSLLAFFFYGKWRMKMRKARIRKETRHGEMEDGIRHGGTDHGGQDSADSKSKQSKQK